MFAGSGTLRALDLGIQLGDRGRWHHPRSAGGRSDLFGQSSTKSLVTELHFGSRYG